MMNRLSRQANWAAGGAGAAAVLLVAIAYWVGALEWLELKSLDLRFRYVNALTAHPDIVCLDIDDATLDRVGRWPWPRDVQAALFSVPAECGVRALLVDLEFNEPQTVALKPVADLDLLVNPAVLVADAADLTLPDEALRHAIRTQGTVYLATRFVEAGRTGSRDRYGDDAPQLSDELRALEVELYERLKAEPELVADPPAAARRLYAERSGGTDFENESAAREALLFSLRQALGRRATLRDSVLTVEQAAPAAVPVAWVAPVYFRLAEVARRCGFVTFEADADGVVRRNALLAVTPDGRVVLQLALAAAWDLLELDPQSLTASTRALTIRTAGGGRAPLRIQLDRRRRTLVPWVRGSTWQEQFTHVSAGALMNVHRLRDRIAHNERLLAEEKRLLFSSNFFPPEEAAAYEELAYALQEAELARNQAAYSDEAAVRIAEARLAELRAQRSAHEQRILAALEAEATTLRAAPAGAAAGRLAEIEQMVGPLRQLEEQVAAVNAAAGDELAAELAELRARLAGKLCLLGYTATALSDMVPTPTEKRVPGVMAHACLLNGLLQGRMVSWATPPVNGLLAILAGLLVAGGSALTRPRTGALLLLSALGAYTILTAALFYFQTFWLGFVPATAAMLLSYVAVEAYRYVFLDRERRQLTKALSQYTSATLARQMAENAELCRKAEMREVTAMFTDLKGFTSISEQIGAERTQAVLNICLGRFSEIMLIHEAMINKFLGDGIFAFWNPVIYPQADHARRACETAIDLQAGLQRLIGEQARGGGDPIMADLVLRVGIATGSAVVGPCGSEQKYDYTCIGDSVNVAARLETANKVFGTTIMVSGATQAQAGPGFVYRPLGSVLVKGKQAVVPIFELLGRAGDVPANVQAYAAAFGAAVARFRDRAWHEAAAAFAACRERQPDDPAAQRYHATAEQFTRTPPPDDWSGALELTEK